ncbi:S-layer homology domain-containing protein [Paratissierella segnis]|uniref:S-layer homology domain-containing protein n=1 Tax=Paratissierella segnis TaxID=2763679 RepID=A0A926IEK0_9FIRM|nr:S-layer homology domain-containing protein [Paratissierella segnis]MBC8587457.1 S-layer homology domain-containing protein [Paratissierella segnis]
MKKGLSLVLVLAMVLGCFSFVSAASYSDVAGTSYEEAVARLSLLEILTGYKDGTFKPEDQITRAEFAAVAVRAKGLEATAQASKGLPTGFSDVPGTHWASGYVGTAAKMGIVNGVGNGQFAPAAPVKYEEAITMIVRALGYEPSAQVRGGYPYGYLIVANENGLLDDVKGTQGAPALRGEVAQIVDNALEIPMMVQVGYGTDTKWVVSGSKEHGGDERYLLDDMGFDSVKGRVTSVNTKTNKITVEPEDDDKVVIEVADDFDFYSVEGLITKFWYKNDKLVVYVVKDEAKFDAAEYDEDEKELALVTEDENYEISKDAILRVDGDKVKAADFEADYAKIVLNDDDEVVFAEGYTLDGYVVVDEVKDDEIAGYGDEELDVEDFLIVKEGKTIASKDLEDGEVVFYNNSEDFAVVATASKTGKIDRVYSDGFRFEGKTYNFDNVKYFDGKNLNDVDEDILDEVVEDEDEIEAIFNFKNKVAVLKGEDKDPDASSFYAVLTEAAGRTTGRRGDIFLSLDVRGADGTKKAYDLDFDVLDDSELLKENTTKEDFNKVENIEDLLKLLDLSKNRALAEKGDVIKVKVDKDGDVTEISVPERDKITSDFKITKTYVNGDGVDYKATPSTVVFYDSTKKAIKIGDIDDEFEVVKKEGFVYYEAGKAVALVSETDADADTKTVVGLLTRVKKLSSGAHEFGVKVAGKSGTQYYVTEKDSYKLPDGIKVGTKNVIVVLTVGEKSDKVRDIKFADNFVSDVTIGSYSGKKLTIKDSDDEYAFSDDYKIFDATDDYAEVKSVRDIVGKKVTLYLDGKSDYYVSYAIVGETGKAEEVKGLITYINAAGTAFAVDGEIYSTNKDTVVKDAAGKVIGLGDASVLVEGDVVDVKDNVITRKVSVVAEAAKVEALIKGLPATVTITDEAKIAEARTAYKALNEYGKAIVDGATTNNTALLETKEAALVDALIDDINTTTPEAAKVAKARAAFDALTTGAKGKVTSAKKTTLEGYEAAEVAAPVIAKIKDLPAAGTVKLTDKAAINEARAAYDALSGAAKAKVDAETTNNTAKLIAAEDELKTLEDTLAANKKDVADAKAALTTLPFDSTDKENTTTPKIVLPTAAKGETYAFKVETTDALAGGGQAVITASNATITRDSAEEFTFEIEVTISKGTGETKAEDKVVFVVTVPTGLSNVTVK